MKKMMLLIPALTLLFSCEKENVAEHEILTGKWNLVRTELFENDTLKGISNAQELTTSYYFYDEIRGEHAGEMYIEEDGEQQTYSYVYDRHVDFLLLDGTTAFNVDILNGSELQLSRSYDQYRSTYAFVKEN